MASGMSPMSIMKLWLLTFAITGVGAMIGAGQIIFLVYFLEEFGLSFCFFLASMPKNKSEDFDFVIYAIEGIAAGGESEISYSTTLF